MTADASWEAAKQQLPVGQVVEGTVRRHEPYGVFVDVGFTHEGLVQIVDFLDGGAMDPDRYPPVGSVIRAVVLWHRDRSRQIILGMRPSQLERTSNPAGCNAAGSVPAAPRPTMSPEGSE